MNYNADTRNRLMYYINSGNNNPELFWYIGPDGNLSIISSVNATRQEKTKITNVVRKTAITYKRVTEGFNARLIAFGRKDNIPVGLNSEELEYDKNHVFIYPKSFQYLQDPQVSVNTQLRSFVDYIKANPDTDVQTAIASAGIIERAQPNVGGRSENAKGTTPIVSSLTVGPSTVDTSLQVAVETVRDQQSEQINQKLDEEAVKQDAGQPINTQFVKSSQQRISLSEPPGRQDPTQVSQDIQGLVNVQGIEMQEELLSQSDGAKLDSDSSSSSSKLSMSMTENQLMEKLSKKIAKMHAETGPLTQYLSSREYSLDDSEKKLVRDYINNASYIGLEYNKISNIEDAENLYFSEELSTLQHLKKPIQTIIDKIKNVKPMTSGELALREGTDARMARELNRDNESSLSRSTQKYSDLGSAQTGSTISDNQRVYPSSEVESIQPNQILEVLPTDSVSNYDSGESPPDSVSLDNGTLSTKVISQNTVAAQQLNNGLKSKYHNSAIIVFFNSDTNPNWDTDLEKNIVKADYDSQSAVDIMKGIVVTEGPKILVSKVITTSQSSKEDTTTELNEILQLHFSLNRNMSRGNRIPKVGISLSSLIGGINTPQNTQQNTPQNTPEDIQQNNIVPNRIDNSGTDSAETGVIQPFSEVTNGVPNTSINLANEYLNSAHYLGAVNHGPRFININPRKFELKPIKKVNKNGYFPMINAPGPQGIASIKPVSFTYHARVDRC